MSPACAFLPRQQYPLIDLIYFDAGGGHRASATALQAVAEQQRRPWQIRLINLRDVLEPADFIRRLTGVRPEDVYNGMLKFGLTAGVSPMLPLMRLLIRRTHQQNVALLARHWMEPRPALVVSLIPHFNRTIFEGLRMADAGRDGSATPMVTIMTDLADCPPHFWIEAQEQFLICATAVAARQALAIGLDSQHVVRTSGMIVRPEFYSRRQTCRADERRRLGLNPGLPTGLVMFGGYGSRRMLTIARRLAESHQPVQLIFICGHNQYLRQQLTAMELPFGCHVEGFTQEVPYFMQLADFFIGKPGPGAISEALVSGLPVIVARNTSTMVQERYNTEWIEQNQLGIAI
ncbi:MAG: galactosyldiacylglycerol synthase, partial [Deltaproteobacteria bacterium]|nr:galactosyldiacylglycerol synthase [Deltaproteobacteria bacterium]